MNEQQWLKSLDIDPGPPPRVDVAAWVLRDVNALRDAAAPEPPIAEAPFRLVALLSALAAASVAVVALVQVWSAMADPMNSLLGHWTLVMQ